MTEFNEEIGRVVVKEEMILEKFDGEPEDGILAERITVVNGEIVKHEVFEDGKLVEVKEV